MEILITMIKYLFLVDIVIWLIVSLKLYFIPVLDMWMTMTPITIKYPIGPSILLFFTSTLFATFIWPAGQYQGTLVFSVLDYALFGYLCVGAIVCSCVTYCCGDLKHISVLHYLGMMILWLAMLCCG